jgi:hypothetical protein
LADFLKGYCLSKWYQDLCWQMEIYERNVYLCHLSYVFEVCDIYVTEYGTALTTILSILFLYLNTVTVTAGTFEP